MAQRPLRALEASPEASHALTIDELGRETGMTVRTIRSHQARGLLPPPEVRQRTGYYGDEHVARLGLVQELQAEGFNLKGIKRLLDAEHAPAERLLGLKRLATAPFQTEEPELLTLEELGARFGGSATPRTLAQAEKLGILVDLGGGRYEAPTPSLLAAAEEVMRHGVPLAAALTAVEQIQRHCEAVSRSFVKLYMDEVWKPFEEAGSPEDRWSEVADSIEHLRPLASEAMLAVFQHTMTRAVETAFGRELERRVRRGR